VQNNCTACHSADTQDAAAREKFQEGFLGGCRSDKMIKVYGAPIEDADVGRSLDYSPRIIEIALGLMHLA